MGANCSNCNCNRDEKEHEIKVEEKDRHGSKVPSHEQGYQNDHNNNGIQRDIVITIDDI